jgi:hypothetical protein
VDGNLCGFLAGEIHEKQATAGLKHDRVRANRRKGDVELVELRDLTDGVFRQIIGPEIVAFVGPAIGQEVNRVLVPHRLGVIGGVARQILRRERLQIEQHQIGCPAAAIALPVSEVLRHRHVDELSGVRRVSAELTIGNGQLVGQPTVK